MNRPHPLGLTSHPNWDDVHDRWCDRFDRDALDPMPALTDLPKPPRPTVGGAMIRDAVVVTLVLIVVWAVGLAVAG